MTSSQEKRKASRRFTHRVERVSTGANCGEHTSFELATKRVGRLVAMSNGRLTAEAFKISWTLTIARPISHRRRTNPQSLSWLHAWAKRNRAGWVRDGESGHFVGYAIDGERYIPIFNR